MPVPKFSEFFEAFLKAINDDKLHTAKEVRTTIAEEMKLSALDLSEMLPRGKETKFNNRVHWAKTYLSKARLVETPLRGQYKITSRGKSALSSSERIDLDFLERFDEFKAFRNVTSQGATEEPNTEREESPMEAFANAYNKVTSTLAIQLMDEIMKLTPQEFEKLVVKLLLKMGYGDDDKAGKATQFTNDGGIDGIIREDQLGFSHIYIQAKQWALDHTVGRQEIQRFVGALQGLQAQKGLFITTAKFSSGALQYASNILGTKVVLVDGDRLTDLMIKHNMGVSIVGTYQIKKIDYDFFAEEI